MSRRRNDTREDLADIDSREDLNYLFREMLGELTVGHLWAGGGDQPDQDSQDNQDNQSLQVVPRGQGNL